MKLLPAIDLVQGKAVRLFQGDYDQMTVYSENPLEVAKEFARCGAEFAHLVDLEGAKSGTTPNFPLIRQIARESGLLVEVGGGIRDMEVARRYLEAGVSRVVLGTAAVRDRRFLCEALEAFGERVAVGVDIRDGQVAVSGWTERTALPALEFCAELESLGLKTLICTDISRDGAMRGPNLSLYRSLCRRLSLDVIASGGVSSMEDLLALRELGLSAAIVGKAYYTGAIDLRRALEAAR